ncbi:50S ribosomal protein L25 [Clostridium sp. C105KSO13]|uniref:50S ribosomal protein L25 n=1 Tax=Clostridium sp. C105KSO13 TaxID=1776045 RepID=UPI00074073CD|nr:50S ribosomal protein L25 [Clostridium sp. C105KSO13]CUX38839.1 50S ribosomal protein L25 [Clostridium sp. C105KSO13]
MNTLKAEKRDMKTKAKRLRREGFVTGNVFGREIKRSIPIQIEKGAAKRLLKTNSRGSQIMLDLDGQSMDVLIKEVDFAPMGSSIYEIDFQALVSDEKVNSVAEVVLLNHEKVVAGVVQLQLREIAFKALPSALVEKVSIDVGDMKIGDTVKVKDLDIAVDKDIDLITDVDADVVTVTEARNAPIDSNTDEDTVTAESTEV